MTEQVEQWEIFEDDAGEHRFRFRAKNGEIVAASEGYKNLSDCFHGISVIEEAIRATVGNGSYSTLPRIQVS